MAESHVNPDQYPCPICGQRSYQWGISVADRPGGRVYARAKNAGWGEGEKLYTRKCLVCSNVQFFTERGF